MPKEPEGKFVKRFTDDGAPRSTSKTYHLYTDCGINGSNVRFVPVTNETVELFYLQPCKVCERKSLRVTFIDALTEGLNHVTQDESRPPFVREDAAELVTFLQGRGYDRVDLRLEDG